MRIIFVDVEASGPAADSGPLELGAAWISDNVVKVRSSLIRPRPSWPLSAWSPQSAAVHGVPLDALASAPEADEVAETFGELFAGSILVSDAPQYDQRWFDKLFGSRGPQLRDFHHEAASRFGPNSNALDRLNETLARSPAPHRAGPDARRLARAWLEAGRRMG